MQTSTVLGGQGHIFAAIAAMYGWLDVLKRFSEVERCDVKGKY